MGQGDLSKLHEADAGKPLAHYTAEIQGRMFLFRGSTIAWLFSP